MWTGTVVVPAEITVAQAARGASSSTGARCTSGTTTRSTTSAPTEGRLLLAPVRPARAGLSGPGHRRRAEPDEPGGGEQGRRLVGGADFAWNDAGLRPGARPSGRRRVLPGAATRRTVDALLAFFDLENLAPTSASSGIVSQPQSPALAAAPRRVPGRLVARATSAGALAALRPVAERIAGGPRPHPGGRRRRGVRGRLRAVARRHRAVGPGLRAHARRPGGTGGRRRGDGRRVAFAESDALVTQAEAIRTIPGENPARRRVPVPRPRD